MSVDLNAEGLEFYSRFLESYDTTYLSEVRKYVKDRGMCIPMMCYSPDFTTKDKLRRDKEILEQREIIKVTSLLGGSFCRVLSGQRRDDVGIKEGVGYVVDSIKACLETAEKYNVCLVMENHYKDGFWKYPEFAQKKDVFLSIINKIDSDYFGVQYDPSNAVVAGDDPIELLEIVKDRVKTVHASDRYIKDGYKLDDLKHAEGATGYSDILCHGVTGKGLNDYDNIFRILKEVGFDGWVSIEDGMNGMDEMKQSVDFLKKMRKKYWPDNK